jgi:hypothetical protein
MFTKIRLNLEIQIQYMVFLKDILDGEHKALQFGCFTELHQLVRSIHFILKALHKKRLELREELIGASVRDFASEAPRHVGDMLRGQLDRLARLEESCMNKADRNADIVLALAGQESLMLERWRNGFFADISVVGRAQ